VVRDVGSLDYRRDPEEGRGAAMDERPSVTPAPTEEKSERGVMIIDI
jgi:hypothetical protein